MGQVGEGGALPTRLPPPATTFRGEWKEGPAYHAGLICGGPQRSSKQTAIASGEPSPKIAVLQYMWVLFPAHTIPRTVRETYEKRPFN